MDNENIKQTSISPNNENGNFYQQLATSLKNDGNNKHSCSYFETLQHQAGIQSTRKNGYYIKDSEEQQETIEETKEFEQEIDEENEIDEIFSFGKDIHTTNASKTILNPMQQLVDEDFYNDVGEQEVKIENQGDFLQQTSNKYPQRGHIVETIDNNNAAIDIRGKLKSKEQDLDTNKDFSKHKENILSNHTHLQKKGKTIKQKKKALELTISIIGVSSIVLLGGLIIYLWHINDKDVNPLDDIVLSKQDNDTTQLPDSTPDVLGNNDTIELGETNENLIGNSRTAENQSVKDKFTIFYDDDANISLMGDLELKLSEKNKTPENVQKDDFVASTNSLVISLYNGEEYGNISIDSVGINAPINYGMSQSNIDKFDVCSSESFGIPGGEVPILIGGHNTNSFRTLQNVKVGDIISINTFYGVFNYEVYYVGIGKVVQNNTLATDYLKDIETGEELFFKNEDGEILNLYTCYDNPDDNQYPTPYRFAVKARRVSGSVDTNYWDN